MKEKDVCIAIKYRFKTLNLFGLPLEKPHFMNALLYTDIYLYIYIYIFLPLPPSHKKKKTPQLVSPTNSCNIYRTLREEALRMSPWEWGALQPPPRASREHGGDLTLCSSRAAVLGDTLGDRHNTGVSGTLKTHSKRGRLVGNFSDK